MIRSSASCGMFVGGLDGERPGAERAQGPRADLAVDVQVVLVPGLLERRDALRGVGVEGAGQRVAEHRLDGDHRAAVAQLGVVEGGCAARLRSRQDLRRRLRRARGGDRRDEHRVDRVAQGLGARERALVDVDHPQATALGMHRGQARVLARQQRQHILRVEPVEARDDRQRPHVGVEPSRRAVVRNDRVQGPLVDDAVDGVHAPHRRLLKRGDGLGALGSEVAVGGRADGHLQRAGRDVVKAPFGLADRRLLLLRGQQVGTCEHPPGDRALQHPRQRIRGHGARHGCRRLMLRRRRLHPRRHARDDPRPGQDRRGGCQPRRVLQHRTPNVPATSPSTPIPRRQRPN